MGTEDLPKSEEAVPAEAPSPLEQQIIRQIEYYFGNFNLSKDKFLREQLKVDDGWVPLETLVRFNRLKKLSKDFNVIVEALKKSPKQLMEVSEDCSKIRRRTAVPVPEEFSKRREEIDLRTVYVKGFKRTNTLDELLEFFKDYNVENIFMKKLNHQNKKPFKGSVFATFETREDAEKFFETKGIKYNGIELLKEWKADYIKRKDEEYIKIKAEKEQKMLKRKQETAQEEDDAIKTAENEMVPGCLLKLTNLDETIMREQIQEIFEPFGTLMYVDYSKGKPAAVLRFAKGEAKSVIEKVPKDGETVKIGSSDATVSLIEGDEEKEYWKTIAIWRAQHRKNKRGNNRGNNRSFQNKKRKWGGNRQKGKNENDTENDKDDESSEPPQKQIKVETSEEKKEKDVTAKEVTSGAASEQIKAEVEAQ